ncbi:unnamed protein product, partial [marine sediment metagenome]
MGYRGKPNKAQVSIEAQGRLLKVTATLDDEERPRGGGLRGGV